MYCLCCKKYPYAQLTAPSKHFARALLSMRGLSLHCLPTLVAPRSAVMQSAVLSCLLPRYHCYILLYCVTVLPCYYCCSAVLHFPHSHIYEPLSKSKNMILANTVSTSLLTPTIPCTTPCHSCMSSPEVGGLLTDAFPSPYMLMFVEQTISPALACLYYTRTVDITLQRSLIQ
jgi:hypothetical protein